MRHWPRQVRRRDTEFGENARVRRLSKPAALLSAVVAMALLAVMTSSTLLAAGHEGFESADVTWRLADYDGLAKLVVHERNFTAARSGQGCEHIRLWANQGTYAHLAHPVEPARIIDELVPSVWVKANRPGLQVLARVVLPRSRDMAGKPLTVLLGGDFYEEGSAWQQLQVRNIGKLLQSEVIRYNAKFKSVDDREAYLDHIVINGYGGPGVTDILLDDLEVAGFAVTNSTAVRAGESAVTSVRPAAAFSDLPRAHVELQSSVMVAGGRPLFAKIVEHNGESFRWLKGLGFNTVWLHTPASRSQLAEAAEAEVWLLCPPPAVVTDEHRPVLAWIVESGVDSRDLANRAVSAGHNARRGARSDNLASRLRRIDAARRPIVGLASSPSSEIADVLLVGRSLLGTATDMRDYGPWLREATRGDRQRPFWGVVETQFSASLETQLSLDGIDVPSIPPALEQIRLAAFTTAAAGARGICFTSRTRLDIDHEASALRAKMLQLINAELALLEPWAAGAESKELAVPNPQTRLSLLEAERSRMLIAIRHESHEQYEPHACETTPLSLARSTVRLTDNAYLLTPNGLQPLRAVDARITVNQPDRISLILLTQDPLAISRVGRDLAAVRDDRVRLMYELAKSRLEATSLALRQIRRADARSTQTLEEGRAVLERASQSLRVGDHSGVVQGVREANRRVQQLRRTTWELEVQSFTSPAASPLCVSFATLPLHREAAEHIATGRWSENLLPAAGFDSLDTMLRSGWRQERSAEVTEAAIVELTSDDVAAGQSALRLVMPADKRVDAQVAPLSVLSPPVSVRAGQLIRIQGWVDVPGLIADRRHRLMIVDSQNGEDLAERITTTRGWQEFTLYRLCPEDGDLRLRFQMLSPGEARLDAVSVSVLR